MASESLVFYAPNLHTGGGFVLLQSLLSSWSSPLPMRAFLDERVRAKLDVLPVGINVYWVKPTVGSRMMAELELARIAKHRDIVLCFHGLPPIFTYGLERVYVFLQNRLYLESSSLAKYKLKTRLRLSIERLLGWCLRSRVAEYIVQTSSMHQALLTWYGSAKSRPKIRVFPFMESACELKAEASDIKKWDFIYVADGEAHKNHLKLVEAWSLLAKDKILPSLALTLSERDMHLKNEIETRCKSDGLKISNLNNLSHEEVYSLYKSARAMIYPSVLESFGLPLIEARTVGLPILASELDFVRDVCEPVQSFDPESPQSIARAVKRFMNCKEPLIEMHSATEFWQSLLK